MRYACVTQKIQWCICIHVIYTKENFEISKNECTFRSHSTNKWNKFFSYIFRFTFSFICLFSYLSAICWCRIWINRNWIGFSATNGFIALHIATGSQCSLLQMSEKELVNKRAIGLFGVWVSKTSPTKNSLNINFLFGSYKQTNTHTYTHLYVYVYRLKIGSYFIFGIAVAIVSFVGPLKSTKFSGKNENERLWIIIRHNGSSIVQMHNNEIFSHLFLFWKQEKKKIFVSIKCLFDG